MKIIRSIAALRKEIKRAKLKGKGVGFIPTMGALHEGHLSLIRKAVSENKIVVVSIFVNPTQFGPKEDFKRYPRNLKRDSSLCQGEGVDIIFAPSAEEMYGNNFKTFVSVEELSDKLCGKLRPGHFKGVATVVVKLFNIVQSDNAYFGQKDAQQVAVIKKLVNDLNIPVNIKVVETLRDKDGLALSSRNAYLSKKEREDAGILPQALALGTSLIKSGEKDSQVIIRSMRKLILTKRSAKVDYIAIVNLDNLGLLKQVSNNCLVAVAVRFGETRLIDNIQICLK